MPKFITHDEEGLVIDQGAEAWKRLRMGYFTGTTAETLLPLARGGYSKEREASIFRVASEVLTGKPAPGIRATGDMLTGVEREPYARMAYEARTDRVVQEVAFIKHDWMRVGCSPDGLMPAEKRGVEFKSPRASTHLKYLLAGCCPPEYRTQVQLCLWLTGYQAWDLCSYSPEFPEDLQLFIFECTPDKALHAVFEKEIANAHAEVNVILKKAKALRGEEVKA